MLPRPKFWTYTWVLTFATCAAPAFAAPWYEGAFRSAADVMPGEQIAVVCRVNERCSVNLVSAGSQPRPTEIAIQAPPKLRNPEIPNNNLDHAREATADNPDWCAHPSFGPVLTPIRAVLQSGVRFTACVDVDGTSYLVLCSLSSDPAASKAVMLLTATLYPSCGALPLCAYYFFPLERRAGQ